MSIEQENEADEKRHARVHDLSNRKCRTCAWYRSIGGFCHVDNSVNNDPEHFCYAHKP